MNSLVILYILKAVVIYSRYLPNGIEKEEFEAADCEKPIPGDKFELPEDCEPKNEENEKSEEVDEDWTILEERKYEDMPIYGCEIYRSEVTTECWSGFANTEEFIDHIQIQLPIPVSKEECKRMIDTGKFMDRRGRMHDLNGPHGVTNIQAVEIGDVQVLNHETYCTGSNTYIDGEFRNNIVSFDYYRVKLTKAVARFGRGEDRAEILDTGDHIKCRKQEEGCTNNSNGATYVWENPGDSCPLVVVNRIHGHRDENHLISRKAGVYLKMNKPEVYPNCDFQIYKTDIEGYMLIESSKAEEHGHELKEFNADDFNVVDWAFSRDQYSSYEQEMKRDEKNREQSIAMCKDLQNVHVKGLTLSEKGSSNIMVWKGVGSFFMVEGEILGSFSCPKVTVHPRRSSLCTYELAVSYKGEDWYLQPNTRILSKFYTVSVCSEAGGAVYKSKGGRYVRANPGLSYIEEPKKRKSLFASEKFDEEDEVTRKYGLFSEKETKQYSHSIQFKSRKHELQTKMATHWCVKNSQEGEGCGTDGLLQYSPIEITNEVEDDYVTTFLKGVLYFGGIGKTLATFNWGYELLMKVAFFFAMLHNLYSCYLNILRRRERQNSNGNIIIDVEDGSRGARAQEHQEDIETSTERNHPPPYKYP